MTTQPLVHIKVHSAAASSARPFAAPVTLVLVMISLAAFLARDLAAMLQFDRTAIAAGELWRLLTGHLTHWNGEHFFWDAVVFVVLGGLLESRNRRCYLVCLLASAGAISAALWFAQPELETYRGLSGLDTALFALLAATLLREALDGEPVPRESASRESASRESGLRGRGPFSVKGRSRWLLRGPKKTPDPGQLTPRRWLAALLPLGLLAALASKITLEVLTGQTLFVGADEAGFSPVPLAHLEGALVGLTVAALQRRHCQAAGV